MYFIVNTSGVLRCRWQIEQETGVGLAVQDCPIECVGRWKVGPEAARARPLPATASPWPWPPVNEAVLSLPFFQRYVVYLYALANSWSESGTLQAVSSQRGNREINKRICPLQAKLHTNGSKGSLSRKGIQINRWSMVLKWDFLRETTSSREEVFESNNVGASKRLLDGGALRMPSSSC